MQLDEVGNGFRSDSIGEIFQRLNSVTMVPGPPRWRCSSGSIARAVDKPKTQKRRHYPEYCRKETECFCRPPSVACVVVGEVTPSPDSTATKSMESIDKNSERSKPGHRYEKINYGYGQWDSSCCETRICNQNQRREQRVPAKVLRVDTYTAN
jgi:hypothetical protein